MSDAGWAVTEPALPAPAWKQGRGGRPAGHCRRDVVDAIRYLVKEGICWRAMPADFPPWPTVRDYERNSPVPGRTAVTHSRMPALARCVRLDPARGLAWMSGPAAARPPGWPGNRGERSLCLGRPCRRDASCAAARLG